MYPPEHFRDVLGLMTVEELCAAIGVTKQTLAKWRVVGQGPPYVRLGKAVFYRYADVIAWVDASVHEPSRLPHNTNAKDPADQIDLEDLIAEIEESESAGGVGELIKAPGVEGTTAPSLEAEKRCAVCLGPVSQCSHAGITTEVISE